MKFTIVFDDDAEDVTSTATSECGNYVIRDTGASRKPYLSFCQGRRIAEPRMHRSAAIADCIRHHQNTAATAQRPAPEETA